MHSLRLAITGGLFLTGMSVAAATTPAAGPIVDRAIEDFVRPAYARFHESTTQLMSAVGKLCADPSPPMLEASRRQFADAVVAWSSAEIIHFGPVTEKNRLERILYWPDRKGAGLRQVQAALAQKDATATDATTLAGKSVAMQGLGALEFILYGAGAETLAGASDPYRCAYAAAVSANMENIAADVETAWAAPNGFAESWRHPGADNPFYHDNAEALGELLNVFVTGLEFVRDVRLNGFLALEAAKDKPRQALFWRSGQTVPALLGNLAALQAFFEASGLGEGMSKEAAWIPDSIDFEFGNAIAAADAVREPPIADVLKVPKKRGKLDYLRVVTSSLSELFGTRLSAELGITAGFSSLDGD